MKSTLHISRQALQANFRAVKAVAGEGVEVLAVVKADAYGHGATLVVPVLAEAGACWFGVSDVVEGAAVRAAVGADPGILVMCGMESGDAPAMLAHELTPVVWTPAHVAALEDAAKSVGATCRVHLEVDTGMGRQGCGLGKELAAVLEALHRSPHVRCEGVMSHLCCAEVANADITREQETRFAAALEQVRSAGISPAYIHLANTSGVDEGSILPHGKKLADEFGATLLVRPGFALYGHVLPLEEADGKVGRLGPRLTPALTWTTSIVGLREVPAGTTVGYGATYTASQTVRLALLPVGYADGFRRGASSGMGDGWVMIGGRRAHVVGRVSMNLTVVDVTRIDGVAVGDEALLLGAGVTAEDHAKWNATIAYDILCGLLGNRMLE